MAITLTFTGVAQVLVSAWVSKQKELHATPLHSN